MIPSCSAMKKVRLPELKSNVRAGSNWPVAVRCFWMKSE